MFKMCYLSPQTHYPGLQTISAVPAQASATSYNPFIATSLASVAMQTSADGTMSQALPPNLIPTTTKAIRADKFEVRPHFFDFNGLITLAGYLL